MFRQRPVLLDSILYSAVYDIIVTESAWQPRHSTGADLTVYQTTREGDRTSHNYSSSLIIVETFQLSCKIHTETRWSKNKQIRLLKE